jgi:acyl-CoA synthetase (AMP-forming)/AMP-acid ligase II/uncharacterized membrane protein
MKVEERIRIAAPKEAVWKLAGDPAAYPRFFSDLAWFQHAGGPQAGVGARYDLRVRLGATGVGGLIEVVEHDPPWELAWTSVRGLYHRGRFRLRDAPEGGTEVTFRLLYQTPDLGASSWAAAAFVVDAVAAPMLRAAVKRMLENLRQLVEGAAAKPGARQRVADGLEALAILRSAGLIRVQRPDQLARLGLLFARWGFTAAAGYAAAAISFPQEVAIVDELGELTFAEVEERTNALARGLAAAGVKAGTPVGVMARNHRWFIEAVVALWKLGATVVLLNTSFAAPQLADVARRERLRALVYDQEFGDLLSGAAWRNRKRFVAWPEQADPAAPTLEELIEAHEGLPLEPPDRVSRTVILTSGTTGRPKGAARSNPSSLGPALALLSKIPLRQREKTFIAAPLFHTWGFSHFSLGQLLASTCVLQRRFDPEATLRVVAQTRPAVLIAVPVMLQRILELPAARRRRHDTSSLRVVAVSGSALPGELAARWMDEFGDNLYNLYGSTEVAWATIATPVDLRAAPGTAGRPPRNTVVRLYDGRIFVGNEFPFEGYTGGGSKEARDGLLATGDRGHFDAAGRLFVDGRDDEMIVSGGENVYPREVEELLARHRAVAECAVLGVADDEFGQALKAFVVKRPRARISADELRSYVRSNLARYKVPREVTFVSRLPRNATGKVVKRELAGGPSGRR